MISDLGNVSDLPLDYRSNASSQSHLSLYHGFRKDSPPIFDMYGEGGGHSGINQAAASEDIHLTSSENEKYVVRGASSRYAAAEVQRIARSDPGGNTPELQFPILGMPGAPNLSISPEAFERKLVIEDPDPSFHRGINSPVIGEPPDEVILEQVGSFHVHHLRNDSLGELPYISTVEELPPSPPPPSSEVHTPTRASHSSPLSEGHSQKGSPPLGMIKPPEPTTTPSATVASGEITTSTVVLPGEYGRRQHSRAGARSQGHRNFGVDLKITSHVQSPPEIITGTRVTPEGPPTTPISPFTSGSREQTKLKGAVQDSPSPLITFLSVISPTEGGGSRMPMPPGKPNSNGILPAPSLGTTAMCFAHAYGCQHIFQPEPGAPVNGE